MRKYRPRILGAESIQVYDGLVATSAGNAGFELAEKAGNLAAKESISYQAAKNRLKAQQ